MCICAFFLFIFFTTYVLMINSIFILFSLENTEYSKSDLEKTKMSLLKALLLRDQWCGH